MSLYLHINTIVILWEKNKTFSYLAPVLKKQEKLNSDKSKTLKKIII